MKLILLRTWTGVVLISFSGILVRLAAVEPDRSAFLRGAYALPVLLVLAFVARRREQRRWRGAIFPLGVVAGALLGADLIVWHRSIDIIGAGLATVLPNLQVVAVGIVSVLLFRERPRAWFWIAIPLVLAGVWALSAMGRPVVEGASVPLGVAFGLATAVFYSGYILLLRIARLRRPDAGSLDVMASATLGMTLFTFAFAAPQGVAAPAPTLEANGWLLVLALGSQVIGWVLLSSSIHLLPAALTSVALLLQPVLAMVWGATLLDEPIGWPQVAGAATVLAGVALAHHAVVRGAKG